MVKKKVRGKSVKLIPESVYKPSIYLDEKQVPAELKEAPVGKPVKLDVTAKLLSRTDCAGGTSSVHLEIDSIGVRKSAARKQTKNSTGRTKGR